MRSLSDLSFSSSSGWGRQRVASRPSTERRARRRRAVDERRDESCRRADGSASPFAGWRSNQRTHILKDRCQEGGQVAHGPRRVRKRRGEGWFASPVPSRRSTRSCRCFRTSTRFCLRHVGSGRSTTNPFKALRRPCTLALTLLPTTPLLASILKPARLLQVRPFVMSASRSRSPSSSLSSRPPVIPPPVSQPPSPPIAKAAPRKKAKKEEVDPAALPTRSQSALRIGAHVSAAGGVDQACVNAASIGYVMLQLLTLFTTRRSTDDHP